MYKNGVLTYDLPMHMEPGWKHLFQPDFKYKEVSLGVRELNNCFVSHYGLVVKHGFLVAGCAPNLGFSSYDESVYFRHWRKASEQYYVSKYGKSLPSIKLDDTRRYLVIHSPWFSYYFWITECIPRLLKVKDDLSNLVLLYPEEWSKISFVNETLSEFKELEIQVIPRDYHVFVSRLVMPEVKPWTPMFIPELVYETRDFLLNSTQLTAKTSEFGDRIYISRLRAARRKFTDEARVSSFFKDYGYDSVVMEDYTFFEQIAIMQKATDVTAMTGAGLINLLLKKEGGTFIDLTNRDYIHKKQYKFHYYKLCNILNIRYGVCFFDRINDPQVDHYSNQNLLFTSENVQELLEKKVFHV